MSYNWQHISTAPDDGTEFIVVCYGEISHRCKIMNGAVYEYVLSSCRYENYMAWEKLCELDSTTTFWIPAIETPKITHDYDTGQTFVNGELYLNQVL